MLTTCLVRFVVAIVTIVSISQLAAQGGRPAVDHANVAYDDDHAAQVLDLYLTKSDQPTPAMIHIHGGGWRGGSKNGVPGWLLEGVRDGKWSVVSVEYRFTDVAPHPAQVNDCLRAVQFVREHADEWNIDTKRMGVTGGSAGGHLSLYVALHDDVARKDSTDPVEQESSRVACAVSFAGPTDWSLLSEIDHKHPAYRQLIGYEPRTPAEEMKKESMIDVSPISFVSKDDPPVMQVHGDADDIVPIEHAHHMHQKLESTGVESELVTIPGANHGVAGAGGNTADRAKEFVAKHLLK